MKKSEDNIDRRDFIKKFGAGAAAVTAAGLAAAGCGGKNGAAASASPDEVPTGRMTYRTNPDTGDKVSLLGYGCMRWPVLKNPDGSDGDIDQDAVNDLVDYALAHGVNYFDNSPHYGRGMSETATGLALSRHPRESYLLTTKMSTFLEDGGDSLKATVEMFEDSKKNLKTDYFDYFLIHGAGIGGMEALESRLLNNGALDFLLDQRKKGVIRNLGFSHHGDVKVFDRLLSMHDEVHWNFVQIQMNYVDWKHASGRNTNAEYLYGELEKRNIPVVIMEPLRGGRLAKLPSYLSEKLKELRPQQSAASWAFRFAGSHPDVLTVLSGMTYMEHLQDNVRTFSPLEPCTDEEYKVLEDIATEYEKFPSIPCTACQYCMPCPYGLDIPGIFAHYNRCVDEGYVSSSVEDENYRKARRAFLVGYDRSVPRLRQASHCIACGQCVKKCPQRIAIPAQMIRIDKYVEALKQGTEL